MPSTRDAPLLNAGPWAGMQTKGGEFRQQGRDISHAAFRVPG